MTGGSEFDEVFFTDVHLPADRLLGPLHGGWGVGMSVLTNERGHVGTAIISLERRLESFSKLGAERQLTPVARQELASLIARGNSYKALAQRQRDEGGAIATTGSSLLKLGISEMTFEIASLRADTTGADAMLKGPDTPGCWPRRPGASPAAPARSSATSSASGCSGCPASPSRRSAPLLVRSPRPIRVAMTRVNCPRSGEHAAHRYQLAETRSSVGRSGSHVASM